jgi:hypothetical protein
MDTTENEEVVTARVDLSQFENMCANLAAWQDAEGHEIELLEKTIPQREKTANAMLAMRDAPPSDHREAQEVLARCARQRAKLTASLQGTKVLIASYEKRIAELRPEYERQQERRKLAAKLRGEL